MPSNSENIGDHHALVTAYLQAMQRGAEGQQELLSLFHDDAEYVESFGGEQRVHRGRAALEEWFQASWDHQPPEISLRIDRIDIQGDNVRAAWTCDSPAFASPSRGVDSYTIRAGRIQLLETQVTEQPRLR